MTLFARVGALGDFVLTLPVLHALLEEGPVHVVCPARYAVLLPPGAARVDDAWIWRGGPSPYRRAVCFSPAMAAALATAGVPEVRHVAAHPPEGMQATRHYAGVLDRPCELDPVVVAEADPAIADRPVVIAPGSGGRAKRWPMARWLEVAAALGDVPVRWVAGPDEAEERWTVPVEVPDLRGLCRLAASAGAWLGPDSGPTHLAAAVGAPTVAIFGPTDPRTWAPPRARVLAWAADPREVAEIAVSLRSGGAVADRRPGRG